ncbi:MauE/DoxX family redox-associated membrane protein [Sphingobacterium sp. LRF_L2]|uniref:MauE/DoxX family redox-associated membrane protein n=1 Tax=Sphingobacterium sp. LRF_L2 TaxID=3369421 RepID=UPI003F5D6FE8
MAASLAGHGLVRLPKLSGFSEWMVRTMETSIVPLWIVLLFSYALPIIEALIGIWLLLGWKVNYVLYCGLVLMSLLILGSCSIEKWDAIKSQLLHAVYMFALLWFWNAYTQDKGITS